MSAIQGDFMMYPWCRRGDLNPHALAGTSPSSWRVCLFRHSDECAFFRLTVPEVPSDVIAL
jgi:hypothetical protein